MNSEKSGLTVFKNEGKEHDGDSIVLYYTDDIDLAQPRIGVATWIRTYAIFGVALILLFTSGWNILHCLLYAARISSKLAVEAIFKIS